MLMLNYKVYSLNIIHLLKLLKSSLNIYELEN